MKTTEKDNCRLSPEQLIYVFTRKPHIGFLTYLDELSKEKKNGHTVRLVLTATICFATAEALTVK